MSSLQFWRICEVYSVVTELPAVFLLYDSPFWSGVFLIFIFSVSVWNGGGFYIEVFGRKWVLYFYHSMIIIMTTTFAKIRARARSSPKRTRRERSGQIWTVKPYGWFICTISVHQWRQPFILRPRRLRFIEFVADTWPSAIATHRVWVRAKLWRPRNEVEEGAMIPIFMACNWSFTIYGRALLCIYWWLFPGLYI